MEFGKVENPGSVDFVLPPDHVDTTAVLMQNGKAKDPKIFFGCAKWGRKDWIGKIYPKGTPEKEFLRFYAHHFDSIELNATHYNIPKVEWIKRWKSLVHEDFIFCPKVYQAISHWNRLRNAERATEHFCEAIRHFDQHLGMAFLQLPPNFSPKTFLDLELYLESFPKDIELALELRHPEWFANPKVSDQTYHLLKEYGVASVITDTSGHRDVLNLRLPSPVAFIRFVGNNLHPTDYTRIDDWVNRIDQWFSKGLERLYFFMHQHDEIASPQLSAYMIEKLNQKMGTSLKKPELIQGSDQTELF
jgi:uncharacterized protein YecE (DUF72 family)